MQVSNNGITFIKNEEGEELTGYPDARGIPTIGVGHTGEVNNVPVDVGMKITAEQSSALLKGGLGWVENTIKSYVKSPLNQNLTNLQSEKKSGNDPDILLPRRQRERALFLS